MPEMFGSGNYPALVSSDEIIRLASECRRRLRQNNVHRPTLPPFLLNPSYHPILLSYLNRRASFQQNRSTAVSAYVDSLLTLSKIEDSLTPLLPHLLQSYTSLFTSLQIPHDSHSSSSLRLFSTHLDSMPAPDLVPVLVSIISYLPHISESEDAQILILLPKCLNLIDSFERMHNRDEYTNSLLDKMLKYDWCKGFYVKMVEIIHGFEYLDKRRRSKFLGKVFAGMKDVDVQDIPWLVIRLLVLASKGFDKREVIEGILMFFGGEEMDAKGGLIMRQVEGTVLLHINSVVEKDPGLAREVKESSFGREHVVSSIVKLGFGLLEGVEEKSSKEIKYDCIAGPVELGLEVLKSLFDHHDGVRNEIIQQCILQILSPKPGVMPIIRLLGDLVQSHPHPLLQRASDLKKLLENFTFSDSEISSSLINVLWPLIKCSRDLQDHTILALQKATFRQESSVHVSAAAAIVELILAEQRSEKSGSASLRKSSSEACSCQKTEVYHITGAGLFQELSGLLRRCLCQQARVREIVYHGLLKLVLIDPLVAEHVLNFILPHFQRFLTKDAELLGIINCIIIENGEVFIEEPFDCLLFCTSWILQLFHQVASNPSDSLDLPGFSLTQDNEEGRTLGSRSLSNGLLQIRDLIKTESLSGILEDFLESSGHKNTESVEVHGQASSSSPSPQATRSWKDIAVACRPLNVKPAQTLPRPFPGIRVDGVPEEARYVLSFSVCADGTTLYERLLRYWPSCYEDMPHRWFANRWDGHGVRQPYMDQATYFRTACALGELYNISQIMTDVAHGSESGRGFEFNDQHWHDDSRTRVLDRLKARIGVKQPKLVGYSHENASYLHEIHLLFNGRFQLLDFPDSKCYFQVPKNQNLIY
ncbi:hypothetical protein DM860_006693 [Cuscuta australis]|uniref:Uncharacterized protein n=1 Tax=Cuscuta australis TaxID=267555 RepID=A0A328D9K1_9ASTE|nr:hypothetical protein DM860_006693 [Cuscuta australis]